MIYMIGGAPRAGKSILAQQVSAKLKIGWISTDILMELLRVKDVEGIKAEWNASSEVIIANAEWFFPYLERLVWGVSSMTESYVIEGVDFLPANISQLSKIYQVRSVFVGCSEMTLVHFDQFPGRSRGYAGLPEEMKLQIVHDVPLWSEFIQQEAERFGYPYVDMIGDFSSRLQEAEAVLTANVE
jgi:2-phosphoglycerate kinase